MTAKSGQRPRPRRNRAPGLEAGMAPEEAMRRIVRAGLKQFEMNLPGVSISDDPEFVHQMRVALRRVRTALKVFRHTSADQARTKWDAPLRRLARALGAQRDWDVFFVETMPHWSWSAASCLHVHEQVEQARVKTRQVLAAAKTRKLMEALQQWLSAPADAPKQLERDGAEGGNPPLRAYASRSLERLERRALGESERFGYLSDRERHRVRIRVKRLRYAVEAFGKLYAPDAVAPYTARLKQLQELLGELTDIKTARDILGKLEVDKLERLAALAWLNARKAERLRIAAVQFAGLTSTPAFWRLPCEGGSDV